MFVTFDRQTVYHGPPDDVLDYFSNDHGDGGPTFLKPPFANPADWMYVYFHAPADLVQPHTHRLDVVLGQVPMKEAISEHCESKACESTPFPLNDADAAAETFSSLWAARNRGKQRNSSLEEAGIQRPTDPRVLEQLRPQRAFAVQLACFAKRALLQELQKSQRLYCDCALMSSFGALFGTQSSKVEVHELPIMVLCAWSGCPICHDSPALQGLASACSCSSEFLR